MTESEINAIESRARAALPYERSVLDAVDGMYEPAGDRAVEPESMQCPLCGGDGDADGARYDDKGTHASTIVAYGIGNGLALAETWVEHGAADALALVAEVRRLATERDEALRNASDLTAALRLAEAERDEALRGRLGEVEAALREMERDRDAAEARMGRYEAALSVLNEPGDDYGPARDRLLLGLIDDVMAEADENIGVLYNGPDVPELTGKAEVIDGLREIRAAVMTLRDSLSPSPTPAITPQVAREAAGEERAQCEACCGIVAHGKRCYACGKRGA